ncbi:MAG: alpha/beta fold hydrolase [Bradymonadia bacterium]
MTTLFDQTPHEMIDVGHSQVSYWRSGAGPDLFFVHGWPLHAATFRHLEPLLSQHFTCHFIDLPGTGQSKWGRKTKAGFAAHAETVEKVVDHLNLDRFAMLGFDSGAAIARVVAAKRKDQVTGLVMGNTEIPDHVPFLLKMLVGLSKMPGGKGALRTTLKYRWMRRSKMGFGGCFKDVDFIDGDFTDRFVTPLLTDDRVYLGQLLLAGGLNDGVLGRLEQIHSEMTAPVLMLWGNADPWFPLKLARGMMSQFPGGAELVEFEGGKLFVHEEFADTFAEHTVQFLSKRFETAAA